MNCEHVRQKLSNVVAAGEPELPTELALHLRTCSSCRFFYDSETNLMRSIDTDLNAIVNQPFPASLLPRVQERSEKVVPRANWLSVLLPAAAVLVIAGLLTVSLSRNKIVPVNQTIAPAQSNTREQVYLRPLMPNPSKAADLSPPSSLKPFADVSKSLRPDINRQALAPEVLISPDELRGLKSLASTVYHEPQVGNAILNPVVLTRSVSKPIDNQEIAPLEVASLEIRPLLVEDH